MTLLLIRSVFIANKLREQIGLGVGSIRQVVDVFVNKIEPTHASFVLQRTLYCKTLYTVQTIQRTTSIRSQNWQKEMLRALQCATCMHKIWPATKLRAMTDGQHFSFEMDNARI